jgi:ADP-ribose pyrophosphatase YjhB (NUDIX family)
MTLFAANALSSLLFIVSAAPLSMPFHTTTRSLVSYRRMLAGLPKPLPKTRQQSSSAAQDPSLRYVSSKSKGTSLSSTTRETASLIPRAAVSVVVRWCDCSVVTTVSNNASSPRWLLIQRGKQPNKGMWSFPGGKIEAGEGILDAAKRELFEETRLVASHINPIVEAATTTYDLKWHNFGAFACSDSIHISGEIGWHYVISQCFVEVLAPSLPNITASDDAENARWWSAQEIQLAETEGKVTVGVWRVLERAEMLYSHGLLECN